MKHVKLLLVCVVLVFLVGCSNVPQEEGSIEVFFCSETDCEEELVERLSEDSKCALYDVGLDELENSLEDVPPVIVERENDIRLGNVVEDENERFMHNKFCVFDGSVWTGSFNPTWRGDNKNDNNVVVLKSKYLAHNYKEEYLEMRQGEFGGGEEVEFPVINISGSLVENYFCPEDSCKKEIMEELEDSEESIRFMTFSFTDRDIAAKLIEKDKEIDVKGVMEGNRLESEYNVYDMLNESGMDVKGDDSNRTMHHKVFIVDNETVITGSMNPTKSGNERNDENIVIIHDEEIASEFMEEFEDISQS